MPTLPFWASFLIKMALKMGLPWLEKHVPPAIAMVLEDIIKALGESTNQTETLQKIHESVKACSGVACPSDLVNK